MMKTDSFTPELLAPAGSLEKLKVAINYGADAVYLAGQKFGLRAAADNFTFGQLVEGVQYAHSKGRKVYVVLNGFLHDSDLEELPAFLVQLESLAIDAVIVSDLGVIQTVKNHSKLEIHLSTQASCLNSQSALFWKRQGVTRIVLGREVSIQEAAKIKADTGLEIEMFIHGSMCMAYSGNCVISNFTQGRDSNRGGCAHSCRFEYTLENQKQERSRHFFMSSKDLNGLDLIEEFKRYKIDSLKIEGRMKTPLYAAASSWAYSNILKNPSQGQYWQNQLSKLSHREYTQASLMKPADGDSIFDEREHSSENDYVLAAECLASDAESGYTLVKVKSAFNKGDDLEVLRSKSTLYTFCVQKMLDLVNDPVERSKPSTLLKIDFIPLVQEGDVIRVLKGAGQCH